MSFPLRTRTRGRPSRNAGVVNVAAAHEFDALGLITWDQGAWYAEDPDWTNPGNGGAVSQWDDGGSGLARHMVQATSSRQPTYSAAHASFNNKPAVVVDGGDDLSTSGTFTAPTKPYSIVLVARMGSNATGILFARGATGSGIGNMFWWQPDSTWRHYGGAGTLIGAGGTPTAAHLIRVYVNDASSVIEVDGTATAGTLGTAQNITSFGLFSAQGVSFAPSGSAIAFAGLYTGNVAAHGSWAAFKADAATHYGLTVA
jgi:hypothetical protein